LRLNVIENRLENQAVSDGSTMFPGARG
jgi:hypothetical protein